MNRRAKLRIGLLQDGPTANQYMLDLLDWAGRQDDLEISHLFIHAVPQETSAGWWRRKLAQHRLGAIRKGVFRLIRRLEQAFLRVYYGGRFRNHTRQYRIDDRIPHTVHLMPQISKSGFVYRFGAEEIAKVRAAGCDVLLRGGSGILRGDILDVTPLGVISFHHGDNRLNRGGPAGFWESYLEWPETGFVLQRLTAELDGGEVLVRGSYSTKWFFLLNQAALFTKANIHLKDLLKKLARDRVLPRAEEPTPYSARLFRSPSVVTCIHYVGRIMARLIRKWLYARFHYHYRWSVSFSFTDWRRAVLWRTLAPPSPSGRFLADPFVWQNQGKTYCLVEDFSFREGVGRISAFAVDRQGASEPKTALAESFHLSFPFLFEFNGITYMCPECSGSGQIRLYRSVEFPYQWEFVKAIMTGVCAGDTMLFERGGWWWMLTNIDRTGQDDFGSELYLYFADSPLSDSWRPHPANPLKIDSQGGRNAGLLRDGDRLFRAGQLQGFDSYGVGIRIYEICSLSPEDYQERLVTEIKPGFRPGLQGIHHISSTGEVTVVDSAKREFVW
jgi:hypothetical protein